MIFDDWRDIICIKNSVELVTFVSGETADFETLPLKAESAAVRADLFTEGLFHDFIWNKY